MTPQVERDERAELGGSGLYVYGVVHADPDRIPPGLVGLDGSPVRLVALGEIAALVGEMTLTRPPGRRADLLAHNDVLNTVAVAGSVVPVQFGSVMDDVDSVVQDLLAPDADRFAYLLEELRGRNQFTVKATYNEALVLSEIVASDPEVAELRRRTRDLPEDMGRADRVRLGELVARDLELTRERDGDILLDLVLPHCSAHVVRPAGGLDHMFSASFLVDDTSREGFENALEAVAEAMHERASIKLMGPFAPYDFVGE